MTLEGAAAEQMSLFSRLQGLNALQWRYLCAAVVLLPVIDVSLRRVGYQRTLAMLARRARRTGAAATDIDPEALAEPIARMVSLVGRRSLWRTTCLRQALALWFFLARRGVETELRIGVEKSEKGDFAAHAWVERHGHVLIGGEHVQQRYVVLR